MTEKIGNFLLSRLKRSNPNQSNRVEPADKASQRLDRKLIYVSSQISAADEGTDEDIVLGRAHYSYKIALNKFKGMFAENSIDTYNLSRPEIYHSPHSFKSLPSPPKDSIHLIFKPFEHIRLLKTSHNIACLAWEFSKVQMQATSKRTLLPMEDYRLIANMVQQIWTPCTYAKEVMNESGINNVEVVPAPIHIDRIEEPDSRKVMPNIVLSSLVMNGWYFDVRSHDRNASISFDEVINIYYGGQKPKIYLMVFNPGDMRKNPGPAIRAFLEFNAKNPDTMLIIKFVWDHKFGSLERTVDTHFHARMGDLKHLRSRAIWVTDEALPKKIFENLVRASDFYVCTSFCEGQNLPLLEAMSQGVVPISVRHTAMSDYINTNNSVVVPSFRTSKDIHISVAKDIIGAEWYGIEDWQLRDSFEQAYRMTDEEYSSKSNKARSIVRDRYSNSSVFAKINDILRWSNV